MKCHNTMFKFIDLTQGADSEIKITHITNNKRYYKHFKNPHL